ncbi:MAG: hypothetical protein R3B06_26575 [Kofleriaceae bacterium]
MRCSNLSAAVVVLALAACKGQGDAPATSGASGAKATGGRVASCATPKLGACRQYDEANLALGTDMVKQLCDAAGGDFTLTACAADGRTGVCAMNEGTDVFYASYPIPMDEAAASCAKSGGRWAKR